MNTSPLLLPSELMATYSDEWAHRPQSHIYQDMYDFAACDQRVKPPHDNCGSWPPQVELLEESVPWSFDSYSSSNHQRQMNHNPSEPSGDVPELSHTPLSCDSSDSLATSVPPDLPELTFSSYVPDLCLFGANESHIYKDRYDPPAFPDSSFAWVDSTDDTTNTIHSPKPVFAYKTFQFDLDRLDRSHSPKITRQRAYSEGDITQRRKRCRDDEDGSVETRSKKRRMSHDAPQLFPLSPDFNCNPPTGWRRYNAPEDSCASEIGPTMEQLFDNMYGWDDGAWSNVFRFTLESPTP